MKRILFFAFILFFCQTAYCTEETSFASEIDKCAAKVRNDWNIPGFSLTVMHEGKTVLSKGYGVKTKGGSAPVDGATVYQIGSVSKSFTAALMAMMVDEGKVRWDDRVKDILPDFELYDKAVENDLRVSDIMTHRMGFRSQALTYAPNVGYDTDDVYRMLSLLKPEYPFRDGMHYNNMTFIIAQKIIEKVSGLSWEDNLNCRIFAPLGMGSASCGGPGFESAENVASPHNMYSVKDSIRCSPIRGEGRALHWLSVVGPAGGINCSSKDLARWAQFHLDDGVAAGRRLISSNQMGYLHSGVAISAITDEKITIYGHCWYIEQTESCRIYYHTGTTWGQAALCVWVPSLNLSFAMLFGSDVPSNPRFALMRSIVDIYSGAPKRDYSKEEKNKWLHRRGGSSGKSGFTYQYGSAVHPAKDICGKYTKEAPFGDAEISTKNGRLYITIGRYGWRHPLSHLKGNTYFFYSDGHRFPVRFKFSAGGGAEGFELDWGYGEKFGPWKRKNLLPSAP